MERLITRLRPHLVDGNPTEKDTLKDITQQLANYRTEAMEKIGRDVIAKMGSVRATNQENEVNPPAPNCNQPPTTRQKYNPKRNWSP